MMRSELAIVLAATLLGAAAERTVADERPSREHAEFFERSVRPILVQRCQKCHGDKVQKGGLRLDSRADLLKGGDDGPAICLIIPLGRNASKFAKIVLCSCS